MSKQRTGPATNLGKIAEIPPDEMADLPPSEIMFPVVVMPDRDAIALRFAVAIAGRSQPVDPRFPGSRSSESYHQGASQMIAEAYALADAYTEARELQADLAAK